MRFGSSQHPEYATSSYRDLCSYHSSFSVASVIGHLVDTDGVRTHDPLLAKQMFYQLNYWPIRSFRFFNMQILFSTGSFVDDQNILKRSGVVNPSASKNLNFFDGGYLIGSLSMFRYFREQKASFRTWRLL